MASQEPTEEQGNTETEEGTIAVQKKRARRVSFAENTSVHFFDRDEEFETPPDPNKPSSFPGQSSENLGHFGGFAAEANNDSKESSQNEEEEENSEEDMDDLDSRSPFLRPIGSPSPGSTFGSATSNDEDNFFGPVSSSFIKPSRLSDSAASDEKHDLTMDSAAFSMHYRSLARSNSKGELKTSTRLHLSFEEKTPSRDSISSNTGNSMVMTAAKKPVSPSSVPIARLTNGCDSNDMSLVGEYIHRYDYDRLSPRLDALLAESSKDLDVVPTSNNSVDVEPPRNARLELLPPEENGIGPKDLHDTQNKEGIHSNEMAMKAVSLVENELGETNNGSKILPSHPITSNFPSSTSKAQALIVSSPDYMKRATPAVKTKEKDAFSGMDFFTVASKSLSNSDHEDPQATPAVKTKEKDAGLGLFTVASKTLSNLDRVDPQVDCFTAQENQSPLAGSTSSLSAKRRRALLISDSPSESQRNVTPCVKLTSPFIRTETESIVDGESASSIQKSISKLRLLEASPFSSALNAKVENLNLKSSANLFKVGTLFEKISKVPQVSHVDLNGIESHSPDIYSQKQLSALTLKRSDKETLINMCDSRILTPKSVKVASPLALPSQVTWSGEKMQSIFLTSGDCTERTKAASIVLRGTADKPSFQKNLADQFCQSPSHEVLDNVSHKDDVHGLPVEDALSPDSNYLSKENLKSSERKRNKDVIFGTGDHTEDINGIGRSQKLQKTDLSLDCLNGSNSGKSRNGDELKHLAEIQTTFLEATKKLLSPSVAKLNLHAIDRLEDLLGQLQKSKTYQMLCTQIQSQKISDHSSNILHKREAKTRSLFHRVVYEQAKLQLMQVKRDKLLKRIQLVRSGIQESEMLNFNGLPQKSGEVQEDDGHSQSFTGNIKDIQEDFQLLSTEFSEYKLWSLGVVVYNFLMASSHKVAAGVLELEETERSIFEFTKAFHTSFKIEGEPSSAETITLVNNHLIKRACLQLLRIESQFWVVDHLESKNGHHIVVFNYLDLIIQRLTITVNPSCISISNKLNETNLIKNFTDMNAYTAFRFVFDAETTRKYVGAPNLAQETQISSSLFGNLLDVLQEIQLARIDLRNLTHTSFCSPSVGYLYLQLCFFDYKHGKKTTLTLDMSCLKRGVYPSEVLPCQIVVTVNSTEKSPSQSLLIEEVTAAVQNLRVGYGRLIQLCRGISQWFNT